MPGCVFYGSGATDQQIQNTAPGRVAFRPDGHDCCLDIQKGKLKESFQNWGDVYSIEFDIVVNEIPSELVNVFQFTGTNGDVGTHGDRIPALFLNPVGDFIFRTSLGNDANFRGKMRVVAGGTYHIGTAESKTNRSLGSVWSKMTTF